MVERSVGSRVRENGNGGGSNNDPANLTRWVHSFKSHDGGGRKLLGGKGAELAEMTSLGLPVPPGFTITTAACLEYYRNDQTPPDDL